MKSNSISYGEKRGESWQKRFLVLFVFFEDSHRCRTCFSDSFDDTQFFPYKMQGVVVAIGFEEKCEIPIYEEAVRSFDHHAFIGSSGSFENPFQNSPPFPALSLIKTKYFCMDFSNLWTSMHLVKKKALRLCDYNVTPTNIKILRFMEKSGLSKGFCFGKNSEKPLNNHSEIFYYSALPTGEKGWATYSNAPAFHSSTQSNWWCGVA